jgi:hypothetical protein
MRAAIDPEVDWQLEPWLGGSQCRWLTGGSVSLDISVGAVVLRFIEGEGA